MYCNCTWTESIHNAHVYILVHANESRNKHIIIVKLNQEIPAPRIRFKDKASILQHIVGEPHQGHVCVKQSDAVFFLVHLSFKTTFLLRTLDISDQVSYDLPFIYEQSCRP